MAPCALVAALFAVTAALLQLAAHLPAAAAAGGTDGAATLVRDSVVEGAAGAAGKGGVACVQSTDVPRGAPRRERRRGLSGATEDYRGRKVHPYSLTNRQTDCLCVCMSLTKKKKNLSCCTTDRQTDRQRCYHLLPSSS